MQYVCGRMSRAALYKEPGSRLPAAAPCLGRHAHPAGRSPNSSSLFLPLAAVVAVAQGLSPAGLFGGSMLFESTRSISLISSQNKNLSVLYMLRLFGGRGWITRAALLKTAHWAVFTLSSATAPQLFESTLAAPFSRQIKQKLRYPLDTGVLGGRGWIRTTEAESSRFTVCPHWPLGNTPIFIFAVVWTACICYH